LLTYNIRLLMNLRNLLHRIATEITTPKEKQQKQEIIEKVVKSVMETSLAEFRNEFHEFKNQTTASITKFNDTVIKIYAEVKK